MLLLILVGGIIWRTRLGASRDGTPAPSSLAGDWKGGAGDRSAWLRRIDELRVEDRPIEAMTTGWAAYRSVAPGERTEVLKALTLAQLADVPEDQATASLQRRVEADPDELDARVALLRRSLVASPLPLDQPRIGRSSERTELALNELTTLLEQHPDHPGAREAVIDALLDSGRIEEARSLLRAWPEAFVDDPRRLRLQARLDLDFEGRPDQAIEALTTLLSSTPHDWHLRARLSRALEMQGAFEDARRQARIVDQLRERLDPDRLGRRLATAIRRLDTPESLDDLANLCASVGLTKLASAWRLEAETLRAAQALRNRPPGT
ncbi:tetratricopeptide repeat protein [Tautonia marina]|uniref:tetratricopeptide repeat protein n=1 Tax=Tautonia marina TaxID=2653855 RepID=UPI001375EDBD|nr:tetratricopeptide repeat protein [Tautonia marina]